MTDQAQGELEQAEVGVGASLDDPTVLARPARAVARAADSRSTSAAGTGSVPLRRRTGADRAGGPSSISAYSPAGPLPEVARFRIGGDGTRGGRVRAAAGFAVG